MKKKILGSFIALAFAAIIGINANINMNGQTEEPSIALSNVEALASGEWSECPNGCYDNGNGCWCHTWYPYYREANL